MFKSNPNIGTELYKKTAGTDLHARVWENNDVRFDRSGEVTGKPGVYKVVMQRQSQTKNATLKKQVPNTHTRIAEIEVDTNAGVPADFQANAGDMFGNIQT